MASEVAWVASRAAWAVGWVVVEWAAAEWAEAAVVSAVVPRVS